MPGTPMDGTNGGLAKLQLDSTENERNEDQQRPYRPEPEAREITQTDRLNKKLLESVLERMKRSDGLFDKFMDAREDEDDRESSEF